MPVPGAALERDGFLIRGSGLAAASIAAIQGLVNGLELASAGTRNLLEADWCRDLADLLRRRLCADRLLAQDAVVLQCTCFSKTWERNWKVPWHQDLSLPVAARVPHPALSGWSRKEGRWFVQAPATLLEQTLAVRLHLDDCDEDNGALRVLPGSHRHGRREAGQLQGREVAIGGVTCPARAGELLLMRPLLVHASSKASVATGVRRILHFVLAPSDPGYGLTWS